MPRQLTKENGLRKLACEKIKSYLRKKLSEIGSEWNKNSIKMRQPTTYTHGQDLRKDIHWTRSPKL